MPSLFAAVRNQDDTMVSIIVDPSVSELAEWRGGVRGVFMYGVREELSNCMRVSTFES